VNKRARKNKRRRKKFIPLIQLNRKNEGKKNKEKSFLYTLLIFVMFVKKKLIKKASKCFKVKYCINLKR